MSLATDHNFPINFSVLLWSTTKRLKCIILALSKRHLRLFTSTFSLKTPSSADWPKKNWTDKSTAPYEIVQIDVVLLCSGVNTAKLFPRVTKEGELGWPNPYPNFEKCLQKCLLNSRNRLYLHVCRKIHDIVYGLAVHFPHYTLCAYYLLHTRSYDLCFTHTKFCRAVTRRTSDLFYTRNWVICNL